MKWYRLVVVALVIVQGLEGEGRGNKRNRGRHHRSQRHHSSDQKLNRQGDIGLGHETQIHNRAQIPQLTTRSNHQHQRRHHSNNNNNNNNNNQQQQSERKNQPQKPTGNPQEQMCPNCYSLEMRKNLRLEQIKDRVLTATGLIHPPNMTGVVMSSNPGVQGIIHDMEINSPIPYLQEPVYDEPEVKTEKLFFPLQPGNRYAPSSAPPDLNIPVGTDVLYFNLSQSPLGNRARRAILHIWLKPMETEILRQVPVSVFKVLRPHHPGGQMEKKPVTTVMESFNPHTGNWVKIEVYQLLQEWLSMPEENLGLVVEATGSQGQQVAVTNVDESPSNAPSLEIHTEDTNRNRARRHSANYVCTSMNESTCCRFPLVVDFVELGWDFIVAPKAYEANFCNGECPFLYAHKYAHTALIQKLNDSNARHGPCCGSRKLSSMKMLYYDHEHNIKFDIIQDMIVDRCGCS